MNGPETDTPDDAAQARQYDAVLVLPERGPITGHRGRVQLEPQTPHAGTRMGRQAEGRPHE